jgi:hypothetical protein
MTFKSITIAVLILLGLATSVMASNSVSEKTTTTNQYVTSVCKPELGAKSGSVEAKRGCCSHHGGVCGCSTGRQVCCDGSFSPSCTCNKLDAPQPSI